MCCIDRMKPPSKADIEGVPLEGFGLLLKIVFIADEELL